MRTLSTLCTILTAALFSFSTGCGSDPLSAAESTDSASESAALSASHRDSLSICWTDARCPRVLSVAHGGAWSALGAPYNSNAALAAAYAQGVDGVKIDVRVTKDNVPVIAHSSPIKLYESIDCANRKIEEMTAAQVTKCRRVPSATETFSRLDEVLDSLRGKLTVELTVKRADDYARTVQEVLARRAEDFAYLEISTRDLRERIPKIPGADRIYYLINVEDRLAEIDEIIDTIKNPRAFMVEIDPGVAVGSLITTRLHPAGLRAFVYDANGLISAAQVKAYYSQGFDVVSTNQAKNTVTARKQIHTARGVTPP
jgi:glycerophosphoryl diester phosphodiesterase